MLQDYYLHLKEHNKKGLNNKNPKEEKEDHLVLKTKINDFFIGTCAYEVRIII